MSDKKARKSSLTAKITIVCVGITFLTTLLLSVVFIGNARGIIQEQATTGTVDNIHALRDQLLARFNEWGALVSLTATAMPSMIAETPVDGPALQNLFRRNVGVQTDAMRLYVSSNVNWLEPDGFTIIYPHVNLPPTWDNTERPWFFTAKANPRRVGYTEPYVDAATDQLAISVTKNVYDDFGRDMGVVAADFGLAFMTAMLEEKVTMPGHRIFLINRQGLFVTHHDMDALLRDDFFDEFGLGHYRNDVLNRPSFSSMDRDVFIYSELIPLVDWILVSVIPTAVIFAEMDRFVLHMILIGIALLVVAAFVSILFTYRKLTVPIRTIKSAAASLVGMDFTVSIKKTENDEIGDLQDAMIKIRDNLKKGIDDIQTTHAEDVRHQREERAAFEDRMRTILDASPIVSAIFDADGNIVDVNKEVENMLGIPDRQIYLNDFNRFLPKHQPDGSDSIQKSVEMLQKCIRDGNIRYEWTYLHSDGSQVPTEEIVHRITIDGKPHAIAYSRDLREYYRERERERILQGKIQTMMEQLNEHVEEQAASVTTSSAATEEMIANIQSVTDTLSKNTQNVKELQEASVAGHTGLSEVATNIQGIARESESLLEINSVMQNIASQTNLLSMNAAIEAAHAGASGRGFAVVADEIRKLAESSSKQSKTIGGVLKGIKGSIDKITKSTDAVLGKFNAIEDGVKIVAVQEDSILNAMEEQGQGSKQILEAVGTVNEVTHKVKEAARRLVETSKDNMHKANDTEAQAFTDELTGVRNKAYFMDSAEQELRYCVDKNRDFNLIMFSVDNLRQIADAHGNEARDGVLKVLTQRTRNSLKQGTLLARYSDEAFVFTLPNAKRETAEKFAELVHKKLVDTRFEIRNLKLNIKVSLGIATKTANLKTLEDIINNATKALASAKSAGGNKLVSNVEF